jgi:hypothetical protein
VPGNRPSGRQLNSNPVKSQYDTYSPNVVTDAHKKQLAGNAKCCAQMDSSGAILSPAAGRDFLEVTITTAALGIHGFGGKIAI